MLIKTQNVSWSRHQWKHRLSLVVDIGVLRVNTTFVRVSTAGTRCQQMDRNKLTMLILNYTRLQHSVFWPDGSPQKHYYWFHDTIFNVLYCVFCLTFMSTRLFCWRQLPAELRPLAAYLPSSSLMRAPSTQLPLNLNPSFTCCNSLGYLLFIEQCNVYT